MGRPNSSSSPQQTKPSPTPQPWKRVTGFRIGKAKPGTSQAVYLGKAEKIKKTLIHKAKLKKQRAKELARAGYDQSAPGPSNPADASEKPDDSMEIDQKRRRPSLGVRKDGMRIDLDDSTTSTVPSKHLLSPPPPSPSASHKRLKLDQPSEKTQDSQTSKNPRRRSPDRRHHANGQPKLSHRVSKILNKLQRGS